MRLCLESHQSLNPDTKGLQTTESPQQIQPATMATRKQPELRTLFQNTTKALRHIYIRPATDFYAVAWNLHCTVRRQIFLFRRMIEGAFPSLPTAQCTTLTERPQYEEHLPDHDV